MAITYKVGQSSDDCLRGLSHDHWGLLFHSAWAGADNTRWQLGCGMRFTGILIPQGVTVAGAYLRRRAYSTFSGTTCNTRLSAENVGNPATFADDRAAFDIRWAARTAARVNWDDIAPQLGNFEYNSPSIVSVIQELVDNPSWSSGNSIVIFWEDFEDRSDHNNDAYRDGKSYDNIPRYAFKLIISLTIPTVTTQAVSGIHPTIAIGNGNIVDLGSSSVTQHGMCWNTGGTPTTADSKTEDGAAGVTGAFATLMAGLVADTLYYVRAYAINSYGTSYGNEVSFTTNPLVAAGNQAHIIS